VVREQLGIEQDGTHASKSARGTEDHCFKDKVRHKGNINTQRKFNQVTVPRIGADKIFLLMANS
jgi:hypothetical protein